MDAAQQDAAVGVDRDPLRDETIFIELEHDFRVTHRFAQCGEITSVALPAGQLVQGPEFVHRLDAEVDATVGELLQCCERCVCVAGEGLCQRKVEQGARVRRPRLQGALRRVQHGAEILLLVSGDQVRPRRSIVVRADAGAEQQRCQQDNRFGTNAQDSGHVRRVRIVAEVRREPPLRVRDTDALALGEGLDLVAVDLADGEVARVRV